MKSFIDKSLITPDELYEIIECYFKIDEAVHHDEKGAGSFCRYVEHNGQSYALLTQRAEKVVFGSIKSVMQIINKAKSPVPILGGATDVHKEGDYVIVMPKVEGVHLPSYVFTIPKNLEYIQNASGISQDAMDQFAKESLSLNNSAVYIDFHGANFIHEQGTGRIRFIDLKRRASHKDTVLCTKFLKMSAYNKMDVFSNPEFVAKVKDERGIDIDFITAQNLIKSYTALCKTGLSESRVAPSLRAIYGENANIEDFENIRK